MGYQVLGAQREKVADEIEPFAMRRALSLGPVEFAALERGVGIRIRDLFARARVGETGKAPELGAPPFGDRACKFAIEVAEEQKRTRSGEFFAHEEQGCGGRQQDARIQRAQRLRIGKLRDALTKCPVADLVVVLQEVHEGGWWQR